MRPRSIAVLSYLATAPGADTRSAQPRLVVLESQTGKLVIAAEGRPALTGARCEWTGGNEPDLDDASAFDLDPARYIVAPGNPALGIRFSCRRSFPAGEGGETWLGLFEQRGRALIEIFAETIAWTNEDRASGEATTARGVVIVGHAAQGGHFDLALRTTIATTPLGRDPALAPEKKAATKVEMKRFVWTGDAYGLRVGAPGKRP